MLDKIRKLIALAAHPTTPVEEARTSAVHACRLIVENGVALHDARDRSNVYDRTAPPTFDWRDLLEVLFRAATKVTRADVKADWQRVANRERRARPTSVEDFMRATEHYANPVKGGAKRARNRKRRKKRKKTS